MSPQGERTPSKVEKAKATVVALICGAALIAAVPAVAAAATNYGPSYGGAAPSAGATNLEFARSTVRTVGPGALVYVKCTGTETGLCTGTVTLSIAGSNHKVPFSVSGGVTEALVVPLGSDNPGHGTTALATASTAQTLGAYAQSTEVLHFK
jgi:hypothetical protein